MNILSLMSGSSLDGTDIGIIKIIENEGNFDWKIVHAKTIPISSEWKEKLFNAVNLEAKSLFELSSKYATYQAGLVLDYIVDFEEQLDHISFHGHTIFHGPKFGYSFQLGCCATLSALTKMKVVGDFRSADIALGGQGAPLMPIVDMYLFREYEYFLNLGGICNISRVHNDDVMAFDIIPCNQILNYIANKMGKEYDEGGEIAAKGEINLELLELLMQDPFIGHLAPKSLDNSYIREYYFPILDRFENIENTLNTCCDFIAKEIAHSIQRFVPKSSESTFNSKMLVSGGGTFNKSLMTLIEKECLAIGIETIYPDEELIHFKELLLMALLGFLRVKNKINVKNIYTEASRDTISGSIYNSI